MIIDDRKNNTVLDCAEPGKNALVADALVLLKNSMRPYQCTYTKVRLGFYKRINGRFTFTVTNASNILPWSLPLPFEVQARFDHRQLQG
jgi:hypothetical protein